ncbi:MAG: hypothetical protein KC484_00450 [Colwelliaceae bacterium]|jgi:hypothetical protein|nr:hypothetical protein [Colwelliaceae bacterium]
MKDDESPLNEKYKPILQTENQAENILDVSTLPEKKSDEIIDTSIIDEEWDSLTQDWQTQSFEKTDIQALLKQTKKRTRWAKSCYVLNIIATLGLLASFIYGLLEGEFGKPWNTYLGMGGLMSLIFVYYERKIRIKTWSQVSDSPDKAIENALAGCESAIKYMALTKWSCLPFGVLANWFVYSIGQEENKSVLSAFIFINVFIGIMYFITDVIHRKRKREQKELFDKTSN